MNQFNCINLTCRNLKELHEKSVIDKDSLKQIRQKTCIKCLPHIKMLYDKFKLYYKEDNYESAFTCLKRAAIIGQIVMEKADFSAFCRTTDGAVYYSLCDSVINDLNSLEEKMKKMYEKCLQSTSESDNNTFKKNSVQDDNADLTKRYVKPQRLIKFVEEKKGTVLILDYRKEKHKVIQYPNNNAIIVVKLNPLDITPGCLLSMLSLMVSISDRQYLQSVDTFDLIVLMGDKIEVMKPLEELPKHHCTWILLEALTTYNNTKAKLKRMPMILENGFDSWNLAYSIYTKSIEPQVELSIEDQFGKLLAKAIQASTLDISYPDLLNTSKSSTNNVKKNSIDFNNENTLQQDILKISSNLNQSLNILNNHNNKSKNLSNQLFQAQTTHKIPNIDRSTKPLINAYENNKNYSNNFEKLYKPLSLPSNSKDYTNNRKNSLKNCETTKSQENFDCSNNCTTFPTTLESNIENLENNNKPQIPDRSTKVFLTNFREKDLQPFYMYYNGTIMHIKKFSNHRNVESGYTGLKNLRNTCFMNATLQALFNTPNFAPLFMQQNISKHVNVHNKYGSKGVISGCFAALVDSVWSQNYSVIQPQFFLDTFAEFVNSLLGDRNQHDAQEFQIYLLDALHEDTNKINIRRPFEQNYKGINLKLDADDYAQRSKHFSSSVVNDIFNLQMVSRLNCMNCQEASVTFEDMNQISVELPSLLEMRSATLRSCLKRHFADIVLDGQSRWICPNCKGPQISGRSTRIWSLPSILIVHMKRFSFNEGDFVKNETEVTFDITNLDMSEYVHEIAPKQNCIYSLYAVTNHDGRLNSGHYTSFVKNLYSQEWLKFDDECCSKINVQNIITKKAFILYYMNNSNSTQC